MLYEGGTYITIILYKNDVYKLNNGNAILGDFPTLDNSEIVFSGKENILFCEEKVVLRNSSLRFNCNNSVMYIGSSKGIYYLEIDAYNNTLFHIGNNTSMNALGTLRCCCMKENLVL